MNLGYVLLIMFVRVKLNIIVLNSLFFMFRNICNKSMLVVKK